MEQLDINSVVDIAFQLKWNSNNEAHTEWHAARDVNLWRDWLPRDVLQALLGKHTSETSHVKFEPGDLFGQSSAPQSIGLDRFSMSPQIGRFYPKGKLSGLPGVFPQNIQPFRCIGVNNGQMKVDTNHPLARFPLALSMTVGRISTKKSERGGSSVDWVGLLNDGPGMQARWDGSPTDFFSGNAYFRKDEEADARYYDSPRLVQHLDETARDVVTQLYKRFIKDGMKVLDLMSSWISHLPEKLNRVKVSGLGMNRTELEQNPVLTDNRVHDLNAHPTLPYASESYDAAICTASIEYLTQPLAVFNDLARVLRPGGVFVVTFSNRWFPAKAIGIWEQIHEFERMGLVMEYFLRSDAYTNLGTYSMRGLPRPKNDRYAGELLYSDPVYAVWGYRK